MKPSLEEGGGQMTYHYQTVHLYPSLINKFANIVNESQGVTGPAAMNDDDALDILLALHAAGFSVEYNLPREG